MATELRFEFSPEVVEEREKMFGRIRELLAEQTLSAILEARQLHRDWLQKYPEDYAALDAGEVLAMAVAAHKHLGDRTDTKEAAPEQAVA